ncbi:MAG: TlpA family protein disulfide reductase [Bacteroidales bacterium]|nr:TlpA family protein disulfide reductase [Bacteroidales bacterium]
MKQLDKWKKKSLFGKISDIIFIIFLILLIIPGSRTAIMAGVNNIKAKIIPPKTNEQVIPQLSDADFNWQLSDIEGNTVSLSDFKGKVIFINFWATWCGPCIGEMPEIQAFYNKFKDNNDVVFILATTDDLTTVQNFISNKEFTFPVYSIQSQIPNVMNHNSIPTSFLINKNGGIVLQQKGVANWGGEKMEKIVNKLLK